MHKMQGMRDFMTTGKQAGSPRADATQAAGLPRSATPAVNTHGVLQSVLQPPAQITSSRQDLAARALLSLPRTGSRSRVDNKATHQQNGVQHLQSQPMARIRTSSETGVKRVRNGHDTVFEDSTVGSMFGDTASQPASDGYRATRHDRHYAVATADYPPEFRPDSHRRDENMPFVFNANGEMKEVKHMASRSKALDTTASHNTRNPETRAKEPRQQAPAHVPDGSPGKRAALKHSKLPHREASDAQRQSYADRDVAQIRAQKHVGLQHAFGDEESDGGLGQMLEDLAGTNEQNRMTIFQDINTPIMDEPSQWQSDVVESGLTEQLPATQEVSTPRPAQQFLAAAIPGNPPVRSTSLRRAGSNRLEDLPNSRKRRLSLDYDDHQLNEMGSSNLRGEAFDFDPRTAALQAVEDENALAGANIETRLNYYKDKDSIAQHQFFRQMSVQDWETSGDWFLDEFTTAIKNLKEARKAKRNLVQAHEAEVWVREDAVRAKTEHIGRTLQKLKQDGEMLMTGKDIDI